MCFAVIASLRETIISYSLAKCAKDALKRFFATAFASFLFCRKQKSTTKSANLFQAFLVERGQQPKELGNSGSKSSNRGVVMGGCKVAMNLVPFTLILGQAKLSCILINIKKDVILKFIHFISPLFSWLHPCI